MRNPQWETVASNVAEAMLVLDFQSLRVPVAGTLRGNILFDVEIYLYNEAFTVSESPLSKQQAEDLLEGVVMALCQDLAESEKEVSTHLWVRKDAVIRVEVAYHNPISTGLTIPSLVTKN